MLPILVKTEFRKDRKLVWLLMLGVSVGCCVGGADVAVLV